MSGRKPTSRLTKLITQAPLVQAFARQLRQVRQSRGLTQQKLANKAGMHWTFVSRLERGRVTPGLDMVGKLADALGGPLTELLPQGHVDALPVLQNQMRQRVDSILRKADAAQSGMVLPWLALLDDSLRRG